MTCSTLNCDPPPLPCNEAPSTLLSTRLAPHLVVGLSSHPLKLYIIFRYNGLTHIVDWDGIGSVSWKAYYYVQAWLGSHMCGCSHTWYTWPKLPAVCLVGSASAQRVWPRQEERGREMLDKSEFPGRS